MPAPVLWEHIETVSNGTDRDHESRVVQLENGNLVVVWTSGFEQTGGLTSSVGQEIYGRILDPLGQPIGSEFQINSVATFADQRLPDIAPLPGGGFIVTYESFANGTFNNTYGIFSEVFSDTGTKLNDQTASGNNNGTNEINPVVAVQSSNNALVVYAEQDGSDSLRAYVVNPSTGTAGATFSISGNVGNSLETGRHSVTALDNGSYFVTWAENIGSNSETIRGVMVNSAGGVGNQTNLNSFAVNVSSLDSITLSNGDVIVAWTANNDTAVRFSRYDPNTGLVTVTDNTGFPPQTDMTYTNVELVALDDGGWVVLATRLEDSLVELQGVVGQRFGSNNQTDGDIFTLFAGSVDPRSSAATLLEDGRFAVVQDIGNVSGGTDHDIFISFHDTRDVPNATPADGYIIGTENSETVNPVPVGTDVIALAGGNDRAWFNLGGEADFYGGDGYDIFGLRQSGTYNLSYISGAGIVLDGVEEIRFNASASGEKTLIISSLQIELIEELNFAQGGLNFRDHVQVVVEGPFGVDLTGLRLDDYEAKFDTFSISGTNGGETIIGSSANETINGFGGNDTINGADGIDTLSASEDHYNNGVIIDLNAGGSLTDGTVTSSISNFEGVVTTDDNDVVFGTFGNNRFETRDGNDRITTGGGFDTVLAGEGNDTVVLSWMDQGGHERIDGNVGFDFLELIPHANSNYTFDLRTIDFEQFESVRFGNGNIGSNTAIVQAEHSQFDGQQFNGDLDIYGANGQRDEFQYYIGDVVSVNLSSTNLNTWEATDLLRIIGSDGINHKVVGTQFAESIETGNGDDTVTATGGTDAIQTGEGEDYVSLSGVSDLVNLGEHDDGVFFEDYNVLFNNGGVFDNHLLIGGLGTDTFNFSGFDISTTIDVAANEFRFSFDHRVIAGMSGFEVFFAGSGNDEFYGSSEDEEFFGGNGVDIAEGGAGSDRLFGGGGNDIFDFFEIGRLAGDIDAWNGGSDTDTALFTGYHSAVRVDLESANEAITRDSDTMGSGTFRVIVQMDNIENIIGTDFSDQLWGDDGDNVIRGGGEADNILGRLGNDTLYGDGGNDFLFARQGADEMYGGAGNDRIVMDSLDTVVHGGDDYDRVSVAGSGAVTLDMNAAEIERAAGNSGNDTFDATGKTDFRVIIQGNGGIDTLSGGELADSIAGGSQSDTLFGNGGADKLYGEAGSDVLNGGLGRDQYFGGAGGFDVFEFSANWDRDLIRDFDVGMDTIRFDGVTDSTGGTLEFSDLTLAQDSFGNARVFVTGDTANTITLAGVDFNDLQESDFEFM